MGFIRDVYYCGYIYRALVYLEIGKYSYQENGLT
tara:strand:- start:5131 stop:5232 length:102 start_codon:yes stop_codon:yes gene_type:complete